DGADYFLFKEQSGNYNSGKVFEKADRYEIRSLQLKNEARKIIFGENWTGDGGLSRFGTNIGGEWQEYEKGEGTKPDKLTIRDFTPAEKRANAERIRRSAEQAERDRRQATVDREAERQRKEREKSGANSDQKKCAECGQEIDITKGVISQRPRGSLSGPFDLHFCSGECCRKYNTKDNQRENNPDNNSP
ncbi:9789_t:CDS:1, partial [Racocetra persica]